MALKGIDISNWQSINAVDEAPDFVIIKATQGVEYVSPTCDAQYQRAKKQGKLLGVYHYASGNDPIAEAKFFLKNIEGYIGEAILVLDWESNQNARFGEHASWCRKFVDYVHEKTGVWCLIYMSASVLKLADWSGIAKDCGLWLAGYPDNRDSWDIPDFIYSTAPWAACAIWQYTSSNGRLDRDVAYMTKTAWKKYAKPGSTPKPEPTPAPQPKPENPLDKYSDEQLADMVIAGKFGNGQERKQKLGSRYDRVQAIVDARLAPKAQYYTIQPGDNLTVIANKFGTSVAQLVAWNNIQNPNIIYAGAQIRVK